MSAPLRDLLNRAPIVTDASRAARRLEEFLIRAGDARGRFADANIEALLYGIADHSPYLWRLICADLQRVLRLFEMSPQHALDTCLLELAAACERAVSEGEVMRLLRLAKQEVALLVALADLGGAWAVEEVMAALTVAADVFVQSALRFILREAVANGHLAATDAHDSEQGCGLVILALGKHGAGELNYSSDTDLVVFFDPTSPAVSGEVEPAKVYIRLTRQFVRLLQERTAEGYVLRVDLRLRPDPGSTAIAISLRAALTYYELYGQNWERAALIKARPIAGDLSLGARFLHNLVPFIWRKYLDYAAIADIHAMKRQIHVVRGHAKLALAGHDVKLGRGGIREIEFFVQTQQLVYGGRKTRLRGAKTLAMLEELAREGRIAGAAHADLAASYLFLRQVEHRLQMIADEQTQRLPKEDAELQHFAHFCGYCDLGAFAEIFTLHLSRVAEHYARLFEQAPELSSSVGDLVFTGVGEDPSTLETLAQLGFKRPSLATETIRGWHFGRCRAVRSERAREVLTELVPALLQAFAESGDPDAALSAFDAALGRMKAAIELLAILKSNSQLRALFANVLGSAPRLAEMVVRRPHVLDAALDADSLFAGLDDVAFAAGLTARLAAEASTEDVLDSLRDVALEESFLIGVRILADLIAPDAAGVAYAALAGSIISAALDHLIRWFAERYGHVPGGRCVILGLGKLGSREMTATSDLDLILIYDFDHDRPIVDGAGGPDALRYFAKLTQRLISALTVATRRGRLYEVDMRLRPSGRKGPVATQLASFAAYHAKDAQVWEHMALTRARVIAGDPSLAAEVEAARSEILSRPPAPSLRSDVHDMRQLIAQEKQPRGPLDLKYVPGGLIDIDFIAQYLSLAHAHENKRMLARHPAALLLEAQQAGYLAPTEAEVLIATRRLYTDITQITTTLLNPATPPEAMNHAVRRRLAALAGLPDLPQLEAELKDRQESVRVIFHEMIG